MTKTPSRTRSDNERCAQRRLLNTDIAEYVIPVNVDIGAIEVAFVDRPDTTFNRSGVKGLGEVSMTGVAAAVANAIFHATGRRVRDLSIQIENLI